MALLCFGGFGIWGMTGFGGSGGLLECPSFSELGICSGYESCLEVGSFAGFVIFAQSKNFTDYSVCFISFLWYFWMFSFILRVINHQSKFYSLILNWIWLTISLFSLTFTLLLWFVSQLRSELSPPISFSSFLQRILNKPFQPYHPKYRAQFSSWSIVWLLGQQEQFWPWAPWGAPHRWSCPRGLPQPPLPSPQSPCPTPGCPSQCRSSRPGRGKMGFFLNAGTCASREAPCTTGHKDRLNIGLTPHNVYAWYARICPRRMAFLCPRSLAIAHSVPHLQDCSLLFC